MRQQPSIYIKPTSYCNLKCLHCYTGETNEDKTLFDVNKVLTFLATYSRQNPDVDSPNIIFHGAEPMLAPIEDLIKFYVGSKKIFPYAEYKLQTNLVYKLTKEHIALFKQIKKIGTSWDHDLRFRSSSQFRLWKNNIDILKKNDIGITVTACLSRGLINEVHPSEVMDMMIENKIDYFKYERLNDGTEESVLPSVEDEIKYIKKHIDWFIEKEYYKKIYDVNTANLVRSVLLPGSIPYFCSLNAITINADGTVSGCPNNYQEKFSTIDQSPSVLLESQKKEFLVEHSYIMKHGLGVAGSQCYQMEPESAKKFTHAISSYLLSKDTNILYKLLIPWKKA